MPAPSPPAWLLPHLPWAHLALQLALVHLALRRVAPGLPPRPAHPLPIGPALLEDEAVLHWGPRLRSAPEL